MGLQGQQLLREFFYCVPSKKAAAGPQDAGRFWDMLFVWHRREKALCAENGRTERSMQIVKKINNNVALAQDGKGNELVVFGKGIGFPAMPYELDDLSRIQRTFYNVSKRYVDLLPDLPEALMLAAGDIVEEAQDELDCELNPNLPFILADHLNFAIQRTRQGVALQNPLSYDVKHLYPKEYQIAARGMRELCSKMGVQLPESETVSVALHLINAEGKAGDMHDTLANVQLIAQLSEMVEDYFHIQIDRDSFNYSRLAMHMRYLVQRMSEGRPMQEDPATRELFRTVKMEYPQDYDCTRRIADWLAKNRGWHCSSEEQLYLVMHIHRVRVSAQGSQDED